MELQFTSEGSPHFTPAVITSALSKNYGTHQALHDLDLRVEPGEVFGLIGLNGAGKTTTMRLHAAELAERLGLDTGRQIRQLSKGNKQKLGLVQAFMHRPDLLVLDEPSSGLDPLVQQEFLQLLREARDRGQTVFLSSHVLSEIQQVAVRVAIRVAILRNGWLVRLASVAELRAAAPRRLRITFSEAEATAALAALMQLLAGFTVQDIVIAEPDLEETVLELYGQEPGSAGLQPGVEA